MSVPRKEWRNFIPDRGINAVIRDFHDKQPQREQTVASPSTLTDCPRLVWLKKHKVPFTNEMGWGTKQRLRLGRTFENDIAMQLKESGNLLWHWADNYAGESDKFVMGEGLSRIEGTPDLLIKLDGKVLISDAKTSRADSFAYVPLDDSVWEDELWYKYKLQVECYYLLCYKNPRFFKALELPLPEACHLFSFALDDGVVKREFTWKPTQKTAAEIIHYANRWNKAYASGECPACQCTETQTKFCPYGGTMTTTKSGYKLAVDCCSDELVTKCKENKEKK